MFVDAQNIQQKPFNGMPRALPWVKYNNPVSLQTAPFKPVHGFFTRFNRQTQ